MKTAQIPLEGAMRDLRLSPEEQAKVGRYLRPVEEGVVDEPALVSHRAAVQAVRRFIAERNAWPVYYVPSHRALGESPWPAWGVYQYQDAPALLAVDPRNNAYMAFVRTAHGRWDLASAGELSEGRIDKLPLLKEGRLLGRIHGVSDLNGYVSAFEELGGRPAEPAALPTEEERLTIARLAYDLALKQAPEILRKEWEKIAEGTPFEKAVELEALFLADAEGEMPPGLRVPRYPWIEASAQRLAREIILQLYTPVALASGEAEVWRVPELGELLPAYKGRPGVLVAYQLEERRTRPLLRVGKHIEVSLERPEKVWVVIPFYRLEVEGEELVLSEFSLRFPPAEYQRTLKRLKAEPVRGQVTTPRDIADLLKPSEKAVKA